MTQRGITDVAFSRDKYGSQLLVDVARTSELPGFIADDTTHRLGFYDLLLITRGQGWLWLEERLTYQQDSQEVCPRNVRFAH